MIRSRYYIIASVLLVVLLVSYGYSNRIILKDKIHWSSRVLNWDDFEPVDFIDGDYDAAVYSDIAYPSRIKENQFKIYAYMDPNQSEWVSDTLDTSQLLIHEQFHFNITEYCARLMRKEVVSIGIQNISEKKLKNLYRKCSKKLDSLQVLYDAESAHNTESYEQRYWELYVTDLLQETAYYANEDLMSYSAFNPSETSYYKHVYHTLNHEVLIGHSVSKVEAASGTSYYVTQTDSLITVKYYNDGALENGGTFETAILTIDKSKPTERILQYRNADSSLNTSLARCKTITTIDVHGNQSRRYFNAEGDRVSKKGVYQLNWEYNKNKHQYKSTYFNKSGALVKNGDQVYHELRDLDETNRTKRISNFNKNNKPMWDIYATAVYGLEFNDQHKIKKYFFLNGDGSFATQLEEYNIEYQYDERGNMSKKVLLDSTDMRTNDATGVCTRKYAYDMHDRLVSTKRFNKKEVAVIGTDDFFQEVTHYDNLGRKTFQAEYYPGYVLKFDDTKWGATRYAYPNDSTKIVQTEDAFGLNFNDDRGISKVVYTLNDKWQITKEVFFDANGNYALTEDAVSIYTYDYDEAGNISRQSTLDSLGNKFVFSDDVATVRWEYDSNNNKIKTTYYTVDDKLANASEGVTYNKYIYDSLDHLVERTNYDRYGKAENFQGAYRTLFSINSFGKDSIQTSFDKFGRLIKGVAITKYGYNDRGLIATESYFSSPTRPTNNYEGVHRITYQYTPSYQYAGFTNFNKSGAKVNNSQGVCREKREYNSDGLLSQDNYVDVYNNPVIGPEGYYKKEYFYNDAGNTLRISTYGTDNRLLVNEEGIADFVYQRLPSSIASRVSLYDADGKRVADYDGVAEYIYSKELNGLYFLEQQLDANGEIIPMEEEVEEELDNEEEDLLED